MFASSAAFGVSRKSPAAGSSWAAALRKRKKNDHKDLAKLLKLPKADTEEPVCKRYMTSNPTYEALHELAKQNPVGLLVFLDEIIALFERLDQAGHQDEKGLYLSGWNGNSEHTLDRILRGLDLHAPAVCLSLLGSTQPGRIAQWLAQAYRGGRGDDGFMQRFQLMVWPDPQGDWRNVDRFPDREAGAKAFQAFKALDELDWRAVGAQRDCGPDGEEEGEPYVRVASDAYKVFIGWLTELERRIREDDLHPALESHFVKYNKLVPALALICHLADGGKNDVTKLAVERALM